MRTRKGHTEDILKVVAEVEPDGTAINMKSEAKQVVKDKDKHRHG